MGLIPGLGRSLGEGNGDPLQYSCLENPMDKGAWRITVHGVAESDMTEAIQYSTVWCVNMLNLFTFYIYLTDHGNVSFTRLNYVQKF